MKCKHEGLPPNAVFCPWCGARLVSERGAVKVPPPRELPSGTLYGRLMIDGKRISVSAQSEEEYYAKARAAKLGLIETKKASPKLTLGKAIDAYINDNDAVFSPSTIAAYKSYRKTRFSAFMASDISKINFQRLINDESKIVKPKTVLNAWHLVTAALAHAGISAPAINLPQKQQSERPWLDYEQIQMFLAAIKGKPYELGTLLALNGLRRSELLHLTAEDIDGDIIHVRGASVVGEKNRLVDKSTNKTAKSARDVHIVIPRISELTEGKTGRLVTTNPTTLYSLINKLCAKHGLPQVGVHGLRHSFASLAYHLGWSELTTMREGGWSNNKTVHDIYTHLAAADANADIKKMRKFFNKNGNEIGHNSKK